MPRRGGQKLQTGDSEVLSVHHHRLLEDCWLVAVAMLRAGAELGDV